MNQLQINLIPDLCLSDKIVAETFGRFSWQISELLHKLIFLAIPFNNRERKQRRRQW